MTGRQLALVVVLNLVAFSTTWLCILAARLISSAPNAALSSEDLAEPEDTRIHVGPPAADLSVAVLEALSAPPRGTVFILHGIRDRKESMLPWAQRLAHAGYRTVRVDSRGQGASTGEWLTYGVQESRDLTQVVDALKVQDPIAVMGLSYGGATAIQWAAREPRVRAAVAVAPFESLEAVVPGYAQRILPSLGPLVPDLALLLCVRTAGWMGGFDPTQANPRAAARTTRKPMLLLHGTLDAHIPPWHSQRILEGEESHITRVLLEGDTHLTVGGDPRLWPPTVDFLSIHLR